MKSFNTFTKIKPDKYLYYSFDLSKEIGLSALKSRTLHGYFYSKKTNNELLKYNMSLTPNWINSLLVCNREKVFKENPNMEKTAYKNSDIYFNTNINRALLPVIIPKKSLLAVLIPDAQYDKIKEGKHSPTFYDTTITSAENIRVSLSNIKKYGLENIYEVRFAAESYYEKSTLSLIQHSIPLTQVLTFIIGGDKK